MKELFGATWTIKTFRTTADYSGDIAAGKFTVNFSSHTGYNIDDPSGSMGGWLSTSVTGPQVGGWSHTADPGLAKIVELFDLQEVTLDQVKRREIIWDLQRAVLDWRGKIITSDAVGFGAYWPEIKNTPNTQTHGNNDSFRLHKVWLAK
jgi:hypothetical protein